MDRVLAEQPPDTWDSFPLFQILNDYLRSDGESQKNQYPNPIFGIFDSSNDVFFHFFTFLSSQLLVFCSTFFSSIEWGELAFDLELNV